MFDQVLIVVGALVIGFIMMAYIIAISKIPVNTKPKKPKKSVKIEVEKKNDDDSEEENELIANPVYSFLSQNIFYNDDYRKHDI